MKQTQTTLQSILLLLARLLMGKGLDKKVPWLVALYKKLFTLTNAKNEVLVNIPNNQKLWVNNSDSGLGLMLRTQGIFEPIQTKWWIKTIKSGMTVVDVGANVGYYSVLASSLSGNVVAVEPEPEMFRLLNKNVNGKVITHNLALGDKVGLIGLVTDDNPGETRIELGGGQVKMTTFSRLVKAADLVKIDVEGAEPLVLSGVKKGSVRTLICECNPSALADFGYSVDDLLKKISDCGLVMKSIIDERDKKMVSYSRKELDNRLGKSSFVSLIARAK